MDIRIEKTKQSIINAFIEIRSRKEVERITVKELCEKARINKSTFYAHYKDIYDLSDQLETELVDSIMENFNHPENLLQILLILQKKSLWIYGSKIPYLYPFLRSRSKFLVQKMESALKALVFSVYPDYRKYPQLNIMLSYLLYGSYYAFYENRKYGDASVINSISQFTARLLPAFT